MFKKLIARHKKRRSDEEQRMQRVRKKIFTERLKHGNKPKRPLMKVLSNGTTSGGAQ